MSRVCPLLSLLFFFPVFSLMIPFRDSPHFLLSQSRRVLGVGLASYVTSAAELLLTSDFRHSHKQEDLMTSWMIPLCDIKSSKYLSSNEFFKRAQKRPKRLAEILTNVNNVTKGAGSFH